MSAAALAISAGLLAGAIVFYVLAILACRKAMRTLRAARLIHEDVDERLNSQLDALARIEEWTA